jgi:hypothetical protein
MAIAPATSNKKDGAFTRSGFARGKRSAPSGPASCKVRGHYQP